LNQTPDKAPNKSLGIQFGNLERMTNWSGVTDDPMTQSPPAILETQGQKYATYSLFTSHILIAKPRKPMIKRYILKCNVILKQSSGVTQWCSSNISYYQCYEYYIIFRIIWL